MKKFTVQIRVDEKLQLVKLYNLSTVRQNFIAYGWLVQVLSRELHPDWRLSFFSFKTKKPLFTKSEKWSGVELAHRILSTLRKVKPECLRTSYSP